MSPLDKTWRDEIIVLVWAVPLLGIFVPGIDTYVQSGWEKLKAIDPTAPGLFMMGWAVIFATTFGMSKLTGFLKHGRFASIISAMGGTKDDVPEEAANEANDTVTREYGGETPTGTSDRAPQ